MKKDRFVWYRLAIILLSMTLQACGVSEIVTTFTPSVTNTPKPTATNTSTPTITPSPTSTPNLAATQQYTEFAATVQEYADAGYISSIEGTYIRLDDFSDSYAQEGYYQVTNTGLESDKFIVRADVTLEDAVLDFSRSGCGFSYHIFSDPNLHELMYLSASGNVYSHNINIIQFYDYFPLASNYYGEIPDSGQVELTFIVNDAMAYMLVDGNLIHQFKSVIGDYDSSFNWKLDWGFVTVSGSSEDFGTRCTYTNVEFWKVE